MRIFSFAYDWDCWYDRTLSACAIKGKEAKRMLTDLTEHTCTELLICNEATLRWWGWGLISSLSLLIFLTRSPPPLSEPSSLISPRPAWSSYFIRLRIHLNTESTLQTHSTVLPQLEGCYRQSWVSMTLKAAGSNVEVGGFGWNQWLASWSPLCALFPSKDASRL